MLTSLPGNLFAALPVFGHAPVEQVVGQFGPPAFSADQILSPYIYVFIVAFVVAFLFTPVMQKVATFYNIIDQPDRVRKNHAQPVAYLGGVAVFLGWLSGLALSQFLAIHHQAPGWETPHPVLSFGIVMGALVVVALGL